METVAEAVVVIVLQHTRMNVSDQHAVHLTVTQYYMSIISSITLWVINLHWTWLGVFCWFCHTCSCSHLQLTWGWMAYGELACSSGGWFGPFSHVSSLRYEV